MAALANFRFFLKKIFLNMVLFPIWKYDLNLPLLNVTPSEYLWPSCGNRARVSILEHPRVTELYNPRSPPPAFLSIALLWIISYHRLYSSSPVRRSTCSSLLKVMCFVISWPLFIGLSTSFLVSCSVPSVCDAPTFQILLSFVLKYHYYIRTEWNKLYILIYWVC